MIAVAGEVAVEGGAFLVAIGLAHTRVHVEHDAVQRTAAVHPVNPSPAEIGERDKVLIIRKPLGLEASHLAGGGCLLRCSTTANDPQRNAGSRPSRSASFTSSYPARRPNTDCRSIPIRSCRAFLPVRPSARYFPAMTIRPSTSSSSRNGSRPASEVTLEPWNSSLRRRSKLSRGASDSDSPAGCAMIASLDPG